MGCIWSVATFRLLVPSNRDSRASYISRTRTPKIDTIHLELDLLQTLTLAALVYFSGIQLRKRIRWLDRLNIPSAVVGGLLFTILVLLLHTRNVSIQLDTALQPLLSVAFFTS